MTIKNLLTGDSDFLQINKAWIRGIGTKRSIFLAILSECYEREKYVSATEVDENGKEWFRCSRDYLKGALGLNDAQQKRLLKEFIDCGCLETKQSWLNNKKYRWIWLNEGKIREIAESLEVMEGQGGQSDTMIGGAQAMIKGDDGFAIINTKLLSQNTSIVKFLWLLATKSDKADSDWFSLPLKYVERCIGISAPTQKNLLKELEDNEVVEVAIKSYDNKKHRYVKLNLENFEKYIAELTA